MKTVAEERTAPSAHHFELETPSELFPPEIKIESILVPLDFSELSLEALRFAIAMAKKFCAAVHLVHVSDETEANAPELFRAGHCPREMAGSMESLCDELLEHGKQVGGFWPEECHVRTGQHYEEICTLVHEIDASLIVLGTRGHKGLKRILLGSTAERVARFAACPVLVTRRSRSRKRKRFVLREILAPIDFSLASIGGAMYAALFAKTFDAKLSLCHVFAGEMPVASDKAGSKALNKNDAVDLKNARLDMEAFTQLDFLRDVKLEIEICGGNAIDEICRKAGESDLVVISTHGRTGLNRMLIGSVAEHVLRHADCPAMVVPGHFASS